MSADPVQSGPAGQSAMQLQFLEQLRSLVPAEAMIVDEEALRVYECDGLSAYRQLPGCVVLPDTVAQVQAAVMS